jgi:hypothetical protein
MDSNTIIVRPEAVEELKGLLEDAVEYWCAEQWREGHPVAGETAYKITECLSLAKQAQFAGYVD